MTSLTDSIKIITCVWHLGTFTPLYTYCLPDSSGKTYFYVLFFLLRSYKNEPILLHEDRQKCFHLHPHLSSPLAYSLRHHSRSGTFNVSNITRKIEWSRWDHGVFWKNIWAAVILWLVSKKLQSYVGASTVLSLLLTTLISIPFFIPILLIWFYGDGNVPLICVLLAIGIELIILIMWMLKKCMVWTLLSMLILFHNSHYCC